MQDSASQILNYWLWLEERGQVLPAVPRKPLGSAQHEPLAETEQPPAAPSSVYLFVSLNPLQEREHQMIKKIADALKISDFDVVTRSDFRSISSLSHLRYVVFLGVESYSALEGWPEVLSMNIALSISPKIKALIIPHPAVMLSQPQLKPGAWNALQSIRPSEMNS